jgi:hypothetical protein
MQRHEKHPASIGRKKTVSTKVHTHCVKYKTKSVEERVMRLLLMVIKAILPLQKLQQTELTITSAVVIFWFKNADIQETQEPAGNCRAGRIQRRRHPSHRPSPAQ